MHESGYMPRDHGHRNVMRKQAWRPYDKTHPVRSEGLRRIAIRSRGVRIGCQALLVNDKDVTRGPSSIEFENDHLFQRGFKQILGEGRPGQWPFNLRAQSFNPSMLGY